MSSSIPGPGQAPETPSNGATPLTRRLLAIKSVAEMASGNTAKLLGHTGQLQGSLDRLAGEIKLLPEPGRVSRLVERMDSVQAMLDWLATRSSAPSAGRSPASPERPGSVGDSGDFSEIQMRLSTSRVTLVDLQSEIQQATELDRSLKEIRDGIASLASDLEALTSVNDQAEALLRETREVAGEVERASGVSANLDDPGGEVVSGQ
jgi:hypothetical protein